MSGMPWQKILGKIGNRAGAATGIGMGAQQIIQGRQAKKKAAEMTPAEVDPNQAAFLAELQQKKNALNTGSQYSSSIDAINDNMAQTQDVLAGNSGGDAGGTISALLKSQQMANRGTGEVLAQGQQAEIANTGMYGDLLNKVAQRKMELGLLGRAQNMAEWAQKSQAGMANLTAGAQSFMDFNGGDKKAANPALTGSSAPVATGDKGSNLSGLNKFSLDKSGDTAAVGGKGGGGKGGGMLSGMMGGGKSAAGGGGGGGMDFSKITGMLSSFGGK